MVEENAQFSDGTPYNSMTAFYKVCIRDPVFMLGAIQQTDHPRRHPDTFVAEALAWFHGSFNVYTVYAEKSTGIYTRTWKINESIHVCNVFPLTQP